MLFLILVTWGNDTVSCILRHPHRQLGIIPSGRDYEYFVRFFNRTQYLGDNFNFLTSTVTCLAKVPLCSYASCRKNGKNYTYRLTQQFSKLNLKFTFTTELGEPVPVMQALPDPDRAYGVVPSALGANSCIFHVDLRRTKNFHAHKHF